MLCSLLTLHRYTAAWAVHKNRKTNKKLDFSTYAAASPEKTTDAECL